MKDANHKNGKSEPPNSITVGHSSGKNSGEALAAAMLGQNIRHGLVSSAFAGVSMSGSPEPLRLMDCAKVIQKRGSDAINGDLAFVSAMCASQAVTLDTMFTEFARRAADNLAEYPQATDRYARLAMKAQANARATLEALARLHQPREQTIKHIHVNEGGQAIIADQFHHHTGGAENAETVEQSHAAGAAGQSPALPCPDAGGERVPSACSNRAEAVSDARRD